MKLQLFLLSIAFAPRLIAQAPERLSYQAVIRDGSNVLVTNTLVGMQVSILQGSPLGTALFVETHAPTTNANGLVSVEIGGGTPVTGSMAGIDWSAGPYFVKTETDPAGGTAYSITGTQELLSVPYALYAANGGTMGPQGPPGPQGAMGPPGPGACEMIRTGDGRVVLYNASTAYGFGYNETSGSNWYTIGLSGPVLGAIASDSCVVLYTATTAYGFGPNNTSGSNWYTQGLSAAPVGTASASGRIVLYTNTTAYGFGLNHTSGSNWYTTGLSSTPVDHLVAGNRIVVYTTGTAYGFGYNEVSGSNWYSSSLSAPPDGAAGTR